MTGFIDKLAVLQMPQTTQDITNQAVMNDRLCHDVVYVEGLTVQAIIGLYEWERSITQPIVFDIAMYTDTRPVARSNSLDKGVNYKAVCDDVTAWTQEMQSELVEELAEELTSRLLNKYAIDAVTMKIGKPIAIKDAKMVGVQITRHRNPHRQSLSGQDEG